MSNFTTDAVTVGLLSVPNPLAPFDLNRVGLNPRSNRRISHMSCDINRLLATYPRERPPLPARYQQIYEQEYLLNRGGGTRITRLALRMESWMHRVVARQGKP